MTRGIERTFSCPFSETFRISKNEDFNGPYLENKNEFLKNSFETVFRASESCDRGQLVSAFQLTFKLSKQNVVIPQGKTIPVTCRVRAGPVPEQIPVVFEPPIDTDVLDDIVISESLTYLQKGSSCSITVLVQNPTNHDIVIKGRMVLGSRKAISTMVPIPCNWSTSENSDNSEEMRWI